MHKLVSEHYCGVCHRLHEFETVCLRYFNVYGPRQRSDSPYTGVITKFLSSAREGKPLTIYGDGSQSRDFVHVHDVAEANFAAATKDPSNVAGRAFNIGTGRSVSVSELVGILTKNVFSCGSTLYQPFRPAEVLHSKADITRARGALEFDPRGSLEIFLS